VNAKQAHELDSGKNWYYIDTLAAAYAEDGKFDNAVEWQTKAIELTPEEDKEELRSRLELYKQGKPYREGRKNP
jgi:tetratricopeptide (TPR) repeat protein